MKLTTYFLSIFMLVIYSSSSFAQTRIDRHVLASGATRASNTAFTLQGSIGQPFISTTLNATMHGSFGFWYQKPNLSTFTERIASIPPASVRFEQNYPNPATATTVLEYSLPGPGITLLTVADAIGRTVMVFPRGMMDAGTYQTTIDVTEMPPGLYFLRLQSNNQTVTRRMTVVR